jgi:arylformamidase
MIYDISTLLNDSTPVYPGDPPVRIDRLGDIAAGDEFSLSSISTSLHAGTHVDAPSHFIAGGANADEIPLDSLVGPAVLIAVPSPGTITAALLETLAIPPGAARVLFRTPESSQDTALGPDGAKMLAESGVKLVGIDRQSIAIADAEAEVHITLLAAGIVIVESLNLTAPPPGEYRLICMPLRIPAEAAPARAVLIG